MIDKIRSWLLIHPFFSSLWEAIKEPLRLTVLAVVSFVVNYVITRLTGSQIDPSLVIALTVVLRAVDKFLYDYFNGTSNIMKSGLTRF